MIKRKFIDEDEKPLNGKLLNLSTRYNIEFNPDYFLEKRKRKPTTTIKIYNLDQADFEVDNLKEAKADFDTEETLSTTKIKHYCSDRTIIYWYLENTKSEYFLILLNKLKKEIGERSKIVLECSYSGNITDVNYFMFSPNMEDMNFDAGNTHLELANIYEADISHAYYRAAYVLGFISFDLYREIITKLTKQDRLTLLGCIATNKIISIYRGGLQHASPPPKKDELLREAWFKICSYVDSALCELKDLLGHDFLFYWVDGIYFRFNQQYDMYGMQFLKHIRKIQDKYNVEFKLIPISSFTLINEGDSVRIEIKKPNGEEKLFFPNRKQIKTYSFVGLNDLEN